jgi:hypothetical protein
VVAFIGFGEAERKNGFEFALFLVKRQVVGVVAINPSARVQKRELALPQQVD